MFVQEPHTIILVVALRRLMHTPWLQSSGGAAQLKPVLAGHWTPPCHIPSTATLDLTTSMVSRWLVLPRVAQPLERRLKMASRY
jgi:hypothetical protein